MLIHDLNFEPYLSSEFLTEKIAAVASHINRDYAAETDPPIILITLGGAVVFAADLVRRLNFVAELAFVKCSSYYDSMHSSGQITFELDVTVSVSNRRVIVVEDIVDTGNTYVALHDHLIRMKAGSVSIATMLLKKEVYKQSLPIDYTAVEIDDVFVIGYGLDYNQLGRNLNGVYKLSK